MKNVLLSLILIFAASGLQAQKSHNWCITDQLMHQHEEAQSDYAKGVAEARQIIEDLKNSKSKEQSLVYTIPVVFHVIYADYRDNISRAQLEDGLRVLNEDFRRLNPDASSTRSIFQGIAADAEIEFVLAKKDPQGNCTDGITRTQSPLSVNARDNVKNLIQWNNKKYFNVWVVNSINNMGQQGTVLGYAYLPSTNQSFVNDGMVIRHDRVGTIGTSVSMGRTFTHEAGHYLGLLHPFGSGNSCSQDDNIADTPPVATPNFGCNLGSNSCNNDVPDLPDMIENYMDYADDNCVNIFTQGQVAIMRSTLQSSNLRLNLRSNSNLLTTGVTNAPDCTPTAIFEADRQVICQGETVHFTDHSEDGDPSSWNWSFPGGSPATSSAENPSISYTQPGAYDVTLTVSNSAGSNSVTYNKVIHVKPFPGPYYPNWSEDFEGSTLPSPDITILDGGDGIEFQLFTLAGSSGSNSLRLNNASSTVNGEIDEVISPAINTIFTSNLILNFDYAFAPKSSNNTDELRIYASTDCGQSWILRRFYKGSQLATAPATTSDFVPTSAQWSTQTINFGAYAGPDPLLVKFEFNNGGGNNFYLDNINFSGTIGQEEYLSSMVHIFPLPASDYLQVESTEFSFTDARFRISDASGKLVAEKKINSRESSIHINLTELDLAPGIYTLHLKNQQQSAIKKISIL